MYPSSATTVAFAMPGGETSATVRARPVDMVHLARQTMGDRALEQEVLGLFLQQAVQVRDHILQAEGADCRRLAHALKGSARSVGAFALADCAEQIEADPAARSAKRKLSRLVDEVRDFLASIGR
jgi:HPt (histidine-containing phosphotransfer) domain-containing protein